MFGRKRRLSRHCLGCRVSRNTTRQARFSRIPLPDGPFRVHGHAIRASPRSGRNFAAGLCCFAWYLEMVANFTFYVKSSNKKNRQDREHLQISKAVTVAIEPPRERSSAAEPPTSHSTRLKSHEKWQIVSEPVIRPRPRVINARQLIQFHAPDGVLLISQGMYTARWAHRCAALLAEEAPFSY